MYTKWDRRRVKHLFIINPWAVKNVGKVESLRNDIRQFFNSRSDAEYCVHVCRWKRDAVGFVQRFVTDADEIVRVYVFGGDGSIFEVVNGIIGYPNVQLAVYPRGSENALVSTFGAENTYRFRSLRNLAFSSVVSLDTIKVNNNYAITNCAIGIESNSLKRAAILGRNFKLLSPRTMALSCAAWDLLVKQTMQRYFVSIDGKVLDGNYAGILVANTAASNSSMAPAIDAVPDDGLMDLYLIKLPPRAIALRVMSDYVSGNYRQWPQFIQHERGKGLHISSDHTMTIALDGELFYELSIKFAMMPRSVNMVLPNGISVPASKVMQPTTPSRRGGESS
jgi:diacylglycerol kinase family enzyme